VEEVAVEVEVVEVEVMEVAMEEDTEEDMEVVTEVPSYYCFLIQFYPFLDVLGCFYLNWLNSL
jgi:hypothetical protein